MNWELMKRVDEELQLQELTQNVPNTRLQCLEIASKLKTSDGQPMSLKELLDKGEELFNFIKQK